MRRDEEKSIVCPVVLAVFTALGCAQAAATDQSPKPNMILCMTDDQGWGDVSYNGLKHIQTPNLDTMAAAGLRFNRFYAQQSCSPTRASVMTGRHPNRMGVFWPGMPLRKQEITVAQAAKHADYPTHQPASDAQATPPPVHQMYNAGHFFELAVAHAQLTGDPKTIVLPGRPEDQLATGLGELGMAGIFQRFLTGWLSPSPFGLGAFPACRRHSLLPLGGAELVLGTVGAMHRQHVQLYTKRHFLFTYGADHRHSFLPDSEFTSEP